jgi:hypothetical protein
MASVSLTLPPDYWKNLSLSKIDLEFVSNYLFEKETPLTENELVPVLIEERVRSEREVLVKQKQSIGRAYLPKEHYQSGDSLVFPALDWAKGKVISQRPGVNPSAGEFEVIEVEFDDGIRRQFAAGLFDHKLNQSTDADGDDQMLNVASVTRIYGWDLERKLTEALTADPELVKIAGRWFPRALLVDVNVGHLNLAEAVLEEAGDKPLPTSTLIEQIELPRNVNPKLVEFSMNYALQEDGRFDEVGPAGKVLWCLKRLEPADVQQIPVPLRYMTIEYDRSKLSHDMLLLEAEIDDELGESGPPAEEPDEVTVCLTYPHWRAGTLPVSVRARGLFPTAYESPRIRFDLVDAHTQNILPAWAVRQHRYVYGLKDYYQKYALNPGSLIVVRKGTQPGQTILEAKVHRPTRDWVRTVLVGSDGGIVFAMLKQNITGDINERMVIAVPDVQGVDEACIQIGKQHLSLDVLVRDMMKELVKLNVQGHVHAQELYSALNVVRRCPPAPLMAFLAGQSGYKHVGDLHFRMAETEAGDE